MLDPVRVAARHLLRVLVAATTPLPDSFPATEIGLMTLDEFLEFKNPKGKHHPSDAYDFSLRKMNESTWEVGRVTRDHRRFGDEYSIHAPIGHGKGFIIMDEGKPVAVVHDGTMYHQHGANLRALPREYRDNRMQQVSLGIERTKPVKYVSEYVPLVSAVAARNRERYNHLLQNLTIQGELFQVRSEGPPKPDEGTALAILNAKGEVVAEGQNEWGATLLVVAQEYRGKGLGQVIGRYWYEFNPSFQSGGFTNAGQNNAIRLWEARVHEFLSRGWYSELLREKRLTQARLKDILSGLRKRPRKLPEPAPEKPKAKGDILVYVDDPNEPVVFAVYDSRFLTEEEPSEDYIHAYGFFRDSPPNVGWFLFTIDYERPFQKLATYLALQMARDNNEGIYVGEGYGDMLELNVIPDADIEREGDYVRLTRDVLPIRTFAALERRVRRPLDPYGEKKQTLIEMAESKWR